MLAVTPAVGDDEVIQADAHDTLGYEPVPEVVGKAFIVSIFIFIVCQNLNLVWELSLKRLAWEELVTPRIQVITHQSDS